LRIAAIARVRNRADRVGLALRRGRQYPRETSFLDRPFELPAPGELVAWSRILFDQEVLVALNTHGTEVRGAHVTVDASLHPAGSTMTVLYPPQNQTVMVEQRDGRAAVRIDLPPAGMVILA
jgi:hypothetical protein